MGSTKGYVGFHTALLLICSQKVLPSSSSCLYSSLSSIFTPILLMLVITYPDYGHGTGHGVGAALNVHEGPISISPRFGNQEVLKKGMVVSNEPG